MQNNSINTEISFTENAEERVIFTKEMKKDYTILIPNMLPIHFRMIETVFNRHGYKVELLDDGKDAISTGVRYVHNDACYPAICSIGQLIAAVESGKYDRDKIALMISQTGGGCRASNYLAMLRKAVKRAGYPNIPVLSLNVAGMEKHPGFKITLPMFRELLNCVLYGDLLMSLQNQCLVREIQKGSAKALTDQWIERLSQELKRGGVNYKKVLRNMREIAESFKKIELGPEVVKVGIVGEIYVKYSALGNNGLEDFLHSENAQTVVPGLLDFCYYCIYNNLLDDRLYGMGTKLLPVWKLVCKIMEAKKDDINAVLKDAGFMSFSSYRTLIEESEKAGCINMGMKMGEGWLLTFEMLELCSMGVKNIVCTQPFGCLPNHIAGKGMMGPVRERYPDANIVAVDYDPGASAINQENRLKLMLANAVL